MTGSAQRISVRLQRATTSQATQTEPLWPENAWAAVADSGSHTFPKMRYRPHRKASKSKGFARWENDAQISTGTNRTRRESQEHSEVSQQNGLMDQHRDKTEPTEVCQILKYKGFIFKAAMSHPREDLVNPNLSLSRPETSFSENIFPWKRQGLCYRPSSQSRGDLCSLTDGPKY